MALSLARGVRTLATLQGIWCFRCLSLWSQRLLIVAVFCGYRGGERWRGRRGRCLGRARVRRLLGLLRKCILVRIRSLRRNRPLAAVQVRNLLLICRCCLRDRRVLRCPLLDFLRALFLRLLAFQLLLRYVGCMCLRRLCQLLMGPLGDVIRGRPLLGLARRCVLRMERRRLA